MNRRDKKVTFLLIFLFIWLIINVVLIILI